MLVCSNVLFLAFLNTLKLFLAKCFIIFLLHSWKMLLQPFLFIWQNAHEVFVNCKIFQYWIEKNVSLHVSPKNCFLEPNLIPKPTKNQNYHPKKCFEWSNHIKIERIGFWEHILRYQRTLMFPIFFPFWTAYLPWTETLLYRRRGWTC